MRQSRFVEIKEALGRFEGYWVSADEDWWLSREKGLRVGGGGDNSGWFMPWDVDVSSDGFTIFYGDYEPKFKRIGSTQLLGNYGRLYFKREEIEKEE